MDNFTIMALIATLGTWFVTALGAARAVFISHVILQNEYRSHTVLFAADDGT